MVFQTTLMWCIYIYFTYSLITHSSFAKFFSVAEPMIFNNLKSELTLLFVMCQSQIEISGQLNCTLCTVIGKMRCNNFRFVTAMTIPCFSFCQEKFFV